MINEMYKQTKEKMKRAIEFMESELNKLRTGKASIALVDHVKVSAYGTDSPLNQVSSINTPDARTIVIQPWDKNLIPSVEKAILAANLGLTPINDGKVIRINIPPLTEERRKDLIRVAHQIAEEGRVAIRNIRRHVNDDIKHQEKDHNISEDEKFTALDKVQEITDEYIKKVDELLKDKEAEINEI
jgi:ribosome recycling factor